MLRCGTANTPAAAVQLPRRPLRRCVLAITHVSTPCVLAAFNSYTTTTNVLQGGYVDADMGLVDLTAALAAAESGGADGVVARPRDAPKAAA